MSKRPIIRAREAATALAEPIVQDEGENKPLDESNKDDQSLHSGTVAEGDDIIDRLASRLGHQPKEKWTRDPSKWKDARTFLEEMPGQFEAQRERSRNLEERLKRTTQAAADAIEETARRSRLEAQAEVRAAAESKDPDRIAAAADRLIEVVETPKPPAQTVAWMAKNPWFDEDPDAQAYAVAVVTRSAKAGATIDEQLEAAEAAVRKRFPEHFGAAQREVPTEPPPKEEVRLSESRRVANPPAVAQGSRGGNGAPRERGYNDIPSGDRADFERKMLRTFVGRGLTADDAKARWAKSYWKETNA